MKMTKTLISLAALIMVMLNVTPKAEAQLACYAGFNYTVGTTTPNGTPVFLYDSSFAVGNITNWNWTFSNGQSSTLQNPTVTFTAPGYYSVCLSIVSIYMNQTCTSTYCDSIYVNNGTPPCNAAFSYSTNVLGTQFSAIGSNNVSWVWSFGDGTSGTGSNPVHTYAAAGTYTVCLTVVNASGVTCNSCNQVTVGSSAGCQAYYVSSQVPGTTIYNFTNQSQGNATYFYWSFGDGSISSVQNPSHTYTSAGTYNVCLTIIDSVAGCSDTYCDTLSIGGGVLCDATFSYQSSPAATVFMANMQNVGASYSWDFGDNTTGTGSVNTHVYASPGTYNVCLTVTTFNGQTCTSCQTVVVQGSSGCSSNFAIYPDSTIQHTYYAYNLATGTGPLTYVWSWGDGTSSTGAYPSHTYASSGTYTICLTITDATGCSSNTCYQFALLRLSGTSSTVTINVVPGTVGISETNLLNAFTLYPNPANDFVNASFTLTKDTELEMTITNLSGQVVYSASSSKYNSGNHNVKIDVSNFTSGMYLMEINAGGTKTHSKILIQ